jgi:hypothetical protein
MNRVTVTLAEKNCCKIKESQGIWRWAWGRKRKRAWMIGNKPDLLDEVQKLRCSQFGDFGDAPERNAFQAVRLDLRLETSHRKYFYSVIASFRVFSKK